jgi:hypothetical protein
VGDGSSRRDVVGADGRVQLGVELRGHDVGGHVRGDLDLLVGGDDQFVRQLAGIDRRF